MRNYERTSILLALDAPVDFDWGMYAVRVTQWSQCMVQPSQVNLIVIPWNHYAWDFPRSHGLQNCVQTVNSNKSSMMPKIPQKNYPGIEFDCGPVYCVQYLETR